MQINRSQPICFITGCSGLIGSHLAKHLLSQNWQVWGVTRKHDTALLNPLVNWISADLMITEKIEGIGKSLPSQINFDAIIHCLGFSPDFSLLNLEEKNFQMGMILNFTAIQKLNQALIPKLNKNSSLILFGSRISIIGNQGQIAYATAKGILSDYTKLLASELGKNGITVNMILPGVHPSDILGVNRQLIMENAKKASLLNQLTNIDDVVNAVLYLIKARSVSGQIFAIESRLLE